VVGVNLSRNFGQHKAITAGLAVATGAHVIVMDCDLQDDPKYIGELYATACEGYDIVYTRKRQRAHSAVRNWLGHAYTKILNWLIADEYYADDNGVGNYSILSRRVVDAFLLMRDQHRHYLALLRWLGFETRTIEIEHNERFDGQSSYTFAMLVRESINGITSQSDRLLRASIVVGFGFTGAAVIAVVALVVAWATTGFLAGWPSLMAVNLLGIGLVLGSLGILGLYIGNIFEQSRGRPLYVVQETINAWEREEREPNNDNDQ
jgi:dolichol-phosphate mannosyltransferase